MQRFDARLAAITSHSRMRTVYTEIQWRRQKSEVWAGKAEEVWGTEVPQQRPGAEPRWGSNKTQHKFGA